VPAFEKYRPEQSIATEVHIPEDLGAPPSERRPIQPPRGSRPRGVQFTAKQTGFRLEIRRPTKSCHVVTLDIPPLLTDASVECSPMRSSELQSHRAREDWTIGRGTVMKLPV
jgi:hypothetical protein